MDTSSHLLKTWRLGVGPVGLGGFWCVADAVLTEPAWLDVDYEYTPPREAVLTLPNGDPGDEPEEREDLTILRIVARAPLHFTGDGRALLLTLVAGVNLCDYFTDEALVEIELAMLKRVRADHEDARLDAYLARQE